MNHEMIPAEIPGCFEFKYGPFSDPRGKFVKLFTESLVNVGMNQEFKIREVYYSLSRKNVLRGMHFQLPPHEHGKIVSCIAGRALDVVLDIRQNSPTYHHVISFNLDSNSGQSIFIPRGCAHGFLALEDNTILSYMVETEYNSHSDCGILWSSINFVWPFHSPVLSKRDQMHIGVKEFQTPFWYKER